MGGRIREAAHQARGAAAHHENEGGEAPEALSTMPIAEEINEGRVPVKVYGADIEPEARQQLVNISRLPIVHHHVAAMPDVHLGIGATVGSVIPTVRAVIPAAVGVNIGCGMMAARLSLTGNDFSEKKLNSIFNQLNRD